MSVTFNGSSYLELVADLIGAGIGEAFFAWIRPRGASLSGNSAAVSSGRFGAGSELSILTIGGASVRAQTRDGTASAFAERSFALSDTWIPVLAVFTSDSSRTLHANGGSNTDTTINNAVSAGAHTRFRIGARGFEDNLFWVGDIAEVAVWSGTLPDATDFAALAAGAFPETIKSGSLIWHRTLETHTDLTVGAAGSTPTANGTLSTGSTHPISRSAGPTGSFTLDDFAFTGTLASAPASSLLGTLTLDDFVLTGTLGLLPGRVDTPPFKNWTGTLLPGVTVPNVVFLKLDRTIALALTSQTTAGDAVMTVENAALVTGTSYVMVTYNADGTTAGAQLVVAA